MKGRRAFERFVVETKGWLAERNARHRGRRRASARHGEVSRRSLVAIDGDAGRIERPVAIVADRDEDAHIIELRIYFSTWPRTGCHATGRPCCSLTPTSTSPTSSASTSARSRRATSRPLVATFEPDGYVREPAGGSYVHSGHDRLRALYERFFSNGGGIPLEHCAATDDGRACALEYNVVRWGRTELPPEAGLAVYVRGDTGRSPRPDLRRLRPAAGL